MKPADSAKPARDLPRPAIRPYPNQYVAAWTMADGTPVEIRPIRPEDEPLMVEFHGQLSERSVYLRYFHMVSLGSRVAHKRLTRICFIDYDREMVLVAERQEPSSGRRSIIAVGRLTKRGGTGAARAASDGSNDAPNEGEVALLVSDRFQRRGLGLELLRRLIEVGRGERLDRIVADILPENHAMQHICQKLGFRLHHTMEGTVEAELDLKLDLGAASPR